MRSTRIAIAAVSCRFADAACASDLWSNTLSGRRSFRDIPASRLDLARYAEASVGQSDSITRIKAGLIADWRFDAGRFRIPATAYQSGDTAHWLALDVAAATLAQVGGPDALDRTRTAVVVANTLTGETSRAAALRMRLPLFEDLLRDELTREQLDPAIAERIRSGFCRSVRGRFPAPNEETLAGGLANTIAGRIANYFDLHAGAYTVDAACASSLVALANAGTLLHQEQADAVLVGGVDVSLDPFELVGFSRLGALAKDDMRVFDARAAGFWPGEGSGFALLMTEDAARSRGLPILGYLRGWGISSDGNGGLTRPDVEGQHLALRRAYEAAGVDPGDAGYIEAHGTGTAVGDPVEVRALAKLRNGAKTSLAIGSIKANIGHTKAAAGFAGMIKAICAVREGIVPPHVGCSRPHPVFEEVGNSVRPALEPAPWPHRSRFAGVSGFGFGGINAHVVLEQAENAVGAPRIPSRPVLQDAELFVFSAPDRGTLAARLAPLLRRAASLSIAEMLDASRHCAGAAGQAPVRAAVVARAPEELADALRAVTEALRDGRELLDAEGSAFWASTTGAPRIGFLFPGQAAPVRPDGGAWRSRFGHVPPILRETPARDAGQQPDTAIAQPVIAAGSLAALELLERSGVPGDAALGHSLGEVCALAWAGAVRRADLVALAASRGAAMAAQPRAGGMLWLDTGAAAAERLISGLDAGIACFNAVDEVVVAGGEAELREVTRRARDGGVTAKRLEVSHAFHSPRMAGAAQALRQALHGRLHELGRTVFSSVTGKALAPECDLESLLLAQLAAPVRFDAALAALRSQIDFAIEVGPGAGLTRLARKAGVAAVATDAFGESLAPFLRTIAYAFTRGAVVDLGPLFEGRATRPIDLERAPQLLSNACGAPAESRHLDQEPAAAVGAPDTACDALAIVVSSLAEETGLGVDCLRPENRLLDDLHLNSIAVARITARAARRLGVRTPARLTDLANATVAEIASCLEETAEFGPRRSAPGQVEGVAPWVRAYAVRWTESEAPRPADQPVHWGTSERLEDPGQPAEEGLLVWVEDDAGPSSGPDLVRRCQDASARGFRHLAICHAGAPLAGFARSIFLEHLFDSVRLIERPLAPIADGLVQRELAASLLGFVEVRLDAKGRRFTPSLRPVMAPAPPGEVLGRRDVVLFTGGAKGIGAECAIRLAEQSGCALILVGRSDASAPHVIGICERLRAAGVRHRYLAADVTDSSAVAAAVGLAAKALGPVTVVIHGAAANEPRRFLDLRPEDVRSALLPKTAGLLAAAAAAGASLRRVVTFGSIIGRVGLEGEAHYALANGWLTSLARGLPPNVSVTNLEWSVWSGAGMAERLGALERLAERGVSAISMDDALGAFERLVLGGADGDFIITSRFGSPVGFGGPQLDVPPRRFVDKPLLHYPETELVVETEVSVGRDPYLADHRPGGVAMFPGVMALEAMAQTACALVGESSPCAIENVSFRKAVLFPDARPISLRIAALATDDGVQVSLRASDDSFEAERFAALFRFSPGAADGPAADCAADCGSGQAAAPLYGPLYFHSGRFRRLERIDRVCARSLEATIAPGETESWFSSFEPQALVLGDPGARDAALHALQACVPHRRVLPVSVERVVCRPGSEAAAARVKARERHADGVTFVFDLDLLDAAGNCLERWEQVRFRAVEDLDVTAILAVAPPLVTSYIERVAREQLDDPSIRVAMICEDQAPKESRRERALLALGIDQPVTPRSDGRPLPGGRPSEGLFVSISHREGMTLAVKADSNIGCDVELVGTASPADWKEVLPGGLFERAAGSFGPEPEALSCTRLWTVAESARKLGIASVADLKAAPRGKRNAAAPALIRGPRFLSVTIPFASVAGMGVVGVSLGRAAGTEHAT